MAVMDRRGRRQQTSLSPTGTPLVPGGEKEEDTSDRRRQSPRPPNPARSSSREVISADDSSWSGLRAATAWCEQLPDAAKQLSERCSAQWAGLATERKVAVAVSVVGTLLVVMGLVGMINTTGGARAPQDQQAAGGKLNGNPGHYLRHGNHGHTAHGHLQQCSDMVPCPLAWRSSGSTGGFYCLEKGGCRPAADGPFPDCKLQCTIGQAKSSSHTSSAGSAPDESTVIVIQGGASADEDKALMPLKLDKPGAYDLRVVKGGKLLGCAAPIGLFPGQPKYGCAGNYSTAATCDAANFPIKDTKYVAAVHEGCQTEDGRGTYGYAYDDGVGLKQCAPVTKYEWVLCPKGDEASITWEAEEGPHDSTKRFRVTNHCDETIWIQQAGAQEAILQHDDQVLKIEPDSFYTYAIPNRGFPSTRFLPKTGCATDGNSCDIQSMPPCPPQGCDLPVDTKFESSWGCVHATGNPDIDRKRCALTGQGNPSTYQDWWDGSAVDGWTLPFSVLVDDAGHGLAPGDDSGSPGICGPVVCANLKAENLCPKDEYLTPVA